MPPPVNQCWLLTDSIPGTCDTGCFNSNMCEIIKVVKVPGTRHLSLLTWVSKTTAERVSQLTAHMVTDEFFGRFRLGDEGFQDGSGCLRNSGWLQIYPVLRFLDSICQCNITTFSKRFGTWNDTHQKHCLEFLAHLNQRSTLWFPLDHWIKPRFFFSDVRHVWVSLCHALVVQVPDCCKTGPRRLDESVGNTTRFQHRQKDTTGAGYSYTIHVFSSKAICLYIYDIQYVNAGTYCLHRTVGLMIVPVTLRSKVHTVLECFGRHKVCSAASSSSTSTSSSLVLVPINKPRTTIISSITGAKNWYYYVVLCVCILKSYLLLYVGDHTIWGLDQKHGMCTN